MGILKARQKTMEEEQERKKQRTVSNENEDKDKNKANSNNSNFDETCIVCMESNSTEKPFMENHQCKQCSIGAWHICVCCNESLLSRTCPVCRSEYAPIVLHALQGCCYRILPYFSIL